MPHVGFRVVFASVWLVNGLLCKVLDWVPRHRAIVSRILGADHALGLTRAIGCMEIVMALWILSGIHWRWSAWMQMVVVAVMNVIEFLLAPDLLLSGKFNSLFALVYVGLVGWSGMAKLAGGASERL